MMESLSPNQNWQQVVVEYQKTVGENLPSQEDLSRFAIRDRWIKNGAAKYHEEAHLARALVLSNVLFSWLETLGLIPEGVDKAVLRDGLSGGAILHDLELNGTDYAEHGIKARETAKEKLSGIISSEAIEITKFLCEWHVPDDALIDANLPRWQKLVLWILKDADSLERVRFEGLIDGDYSAEQIQQAQLNPDFLRSEQAKKLISVAKEFYQRTKNIDEIDPTDSCNQVFDHAVEMGLLRQ
jgi:hypothetical protein